MMFERDNMEIVDRYNNLPFFIRWFAQFVMYLILQHPSDGVKRYSIYELKKNWKSIADAWRLK